MNKIIVLLSMVLLTACSTNTETSPEKEPSRVEDDQTMTETALFFQSEEKGIMIEEANNFSFVAEKSNTVSFQKEDLKAIISVLTPTNDLTNVKQALKDGSGNITVIEETDGYLAFQSNHAEPIRTEVYLTVTGSHTYVTTFMMKAPEYEQYFSDIEHFRDALTFY
ncbi:hypothetical protein DES38_103258 [Streptohalobacillus salinus]|uniref:PsbP protein n=1 Tax=Streptohalobacillus salinus TaxID=621096 RepID=A0A2V3WCE2_9BACI|nr:hypothetical protein [Streptohalobacillus salinus]PXW92239.1 hypothetical protein DES38_103258 [Streptohalobacillus salinus]